MNAEGSQRIRDFSKLMTAARHVDVPQLLQWLEFQAPANSRARRRSLLRTIEQAMTVRIEQEEIDAILAWVG